MLPAAVRYARECKDHHPAVRVQRRLTRRNQSPPIPEPPWRDLFITTRRNTSPPETAADPYLRPAFSLSERLRRLVWNICWALALSHVAAAVACAGARFCCACSARRWGRTATSIPDRRYGLRGTCLRRPGDRGGWRRDLQSRAGHASARTRSSRRTPMCAGRPTTTTIRHFPCSPTRWSSAPTPGSARAPPSRRE